MRALPHSFLVLPLGFLVLPLGLLAIGMISCGTRAGTRSEGARHTAIVDIVTHLVEDYAGVSDSAHVVVIETMRADVHPMLGIHGVNVLSPDDALWSQALDGLRASTGVDMNRSLGRDIALPGGAANGLSVERWSRARESAWFAGDLDVAWERFHTAYPDSVGIIDFSPVAFSADGLQALVEMARQSGSSDGNGMLFLLAKRDGRWRVIAFRETWIS